MKLGFDKNGTRKRLLGIPITIMLVLSLSGCHPFAAVPGETSASPGDTHAAWYYFDWMAEAPYAPVFHVLDTQSSLGPYAQGTKTITLEDLVKMHGHACDGLVTASMALSVGLKELYPDGVIDRTDTGAMTNNSPCYGDAAAYLTGGRVRFGTQKIDPRFKDEFILYRFSTGKAVKVTLKPGVFPHEVKLLEGKIRSGEFTLEEMRRCRRLQWAYARALLNRPPEESFTLEILDDFLWQPDPYENMGVRGDIVNKNVLREGAGGFSRPPRESP